MSILKKLYEKSEIWFSIAWIIAYCVLMSVGDNLSSTLGAEKSITLVIGLVLSFVLFAFLKKNKLIKKYGFCHSQSTNKSMLFYIPILIMLSANLWYGLTLNYGISETVFYVLSMLCVGFLEEVIFRGLLFEAMRKGNTKVAIIVSSLTFGIGHIINLFNGAGMDLLPSLLQILYATTAGFMFVMIYYKSKSIVACVVSHGLFNALSAFSNEAIQTQQSRIITSILLAIITGTYALYLAWSMRRKDNNWNGNQKGNTPNM